MVGASEAASEVVLGVVGRHGRGEIILGGVGDCRGRDKLERSPRQELDKGALTQGGGRMSGKDRERGPTELENAEVETVNKECKVKAAMKEEEAGFEGWRGRAIF